MCWRPNLTGWVLSYSRRCIYNIHTSCYIHLCSYLKYVYIYIYIYICYPNIYIYIYTSIVSCVFCWLWGIIILLVPTQGLRLAYAATVGAYAGTSCRKFAYAAYARVVLLRRCLRGYQSRQLFPTCQVRVVRFYVSCLLLRLLFFSSSSFSSPTAMMWAQCPLPDLNRDRVSTVLLAGPQPRSCEFSVPCRTSTAIMCSSVCLGRC